MDPLRETFKAHVTKNGLDAVARATQGSIGADGKQETMVSLAKAAEFGYRLLIVSIVPVSQDPKSYVTALLEVYKKNLSVVEKPFEGDTGFQAALDKVCFYVRSRIKFRVTDPSFRPGTRPAQSLSTRIRRLRTTTNRPS